MEEIVTSLPPPSDLLASLGLQGLLEEGEFVRPVPGALADGRRARLALAPPELIRALRVVLEGDTAGSWSPVLKAAGNGAGRAFAQQLEAHLSALGQPGLAALPLEACLILLERHVARQGWGALKLDLSEAPTHGLVVARLQNSLFAEALSDQSALADPLAAGVLQGFFSHVTGEVLGCDEIGCAACGESACTFVITAPERLASVQAMVGVEPATAILDRLKT